MADHPLKGLYLTRLYHEGSDPFAVVTDQPREQALESCSKFAPWRRADDEAGGQAAYLDSRLETENFLRDAASNAGVGIKKQHPIYFTLTAEDQTDKAPPGMKAVSIPAEKADLKSCSFTYGDSMGNRSSNAPHDAAHPLQDAVLNADQAAKAVTAYGIPGDYIKGGRYIEVQMWTTPETASSAPGPVAPEKPAAKISSSATP